MYILECKEQIELTILLQYMDSLVIERKRLESSCGHHELCSRKSIYLHDCRRGLHHVLSIVKLAV